MQHVNLILLVGEYCEGVNCSDLAELGGIGRCGMYQKLHRVMSAGFIRKVGKLYFLTDSGQMVYDTVCREFDASLKIITKAILEDSDRF